MLLDVKSYASGVYKKRAPIVLDCNCILAVVGYWIRRTKEGTISSKVSSLQLLATSLGGFPAFVWLNALTPYSDCFSALALY